MFYGHIFMESSDEESDVVPALTRNRELRNSSTILEMSEHEFISNFRMNKHCFVEILHEVGPKMAETQKITAIPPIIKLATFLRFLATGSYQQSVGNENIASMSQPRVSQTISECLDIFEQHMCAKWIRFQMSAEEEIEMKQKFYIKHQFPGVIGCVDGTHIRIKAPSEDIRHLYYNRKGYYSINAMVVCDCDLVIRCVDGRNPGANHDAYVWRMSDAEQFMKSSYAAGKRNTWLLGDSGYPLLPYLMTPYREPQNRTKINYNMRHSKTRNVVERCFGVLKNRFRCILGERGLHYSPEIATKVINACCALHNICIYYKNEWILDCEVEAEDDIDAAEMPTSSASAVRDELAENMQ